MRRYYLSELIGDGSDDDPFRPAIASIARPGMNWSAHYPPQDVLTGQYLGTLCLVIVEMSNHSPLLFDQRNDALPDFPFDGRVSALSQARRDALRLALQRRGLTAAVGNIDSFDGYRQVIQRIGESIAPGFNENALDVS